MILSAGRHHSAAESAPTSACLQGLAAVGSKMRLSAIQIQILCLLLLTGKNSVTSLGLSAVLFATVTHVDAQRTGVQLGNLLASYVLRPAPRFPR